MVIGIAVLVGIVFIAVLTLVLPAVSERLAIVLLDLSVGDYESGFPYPFTIQNVMHLIFFAGLGELYVRWRTARHEKQFARQQLLPEDDATVLQSRDLGPIRLQLAGKFDAENGFLPYLMDLSILQFHASRSVDQTVSVLNSSLELIAHRVDLRYSMLRYIAWVIPTVGFIGTVIGIASALLGIDPDNLDLKAVTGDLGVAFNTTLVALILSGILMLFIHLVQKEEEESVNLAGSYCLKNLINRLYAGS